MVGNIYINGGIGDEYDIDGNLVEKGVNLVDVIAQVKRQPQAERYKLYITSFGGDVQTGFDIYDYLKSLKKPIHSIGIGMVASIATVIFLAGDQREMRSGEFMVHLPSGGVIGNTEEIDAYNTMIKNWEKRIVKHFHDTIGLAEAEILPLMKNETFLKPDETFSLGITNIKPEVIKPVAFFNNNSKKSEMTEEEKKGWKAEIKNLLKSAIDAVIKPKSKIVFDAEQKEVDFYELGDNDPITVGDKANIDGVAAEGKVLMADGQTFMFTAGELTEIIEAGADPNMEQMKAENEALKEELAELKASNKEAEETITELKASNKELGKVVKRVQELEASMKLDGKKKKPEGGAGGKKESRFKLAAGNIKK